MNKPAYTISDQIALLKQRGMIFKDETQAIDRLKIISYYRLKGYWWDAQSDVLLHVFLPNTFFEDILERYDFDRKLRKLPRTTCRCVENHGSRLSGYAFQTLQKSEY